jgi:hypothetical protein
VGQQILFEPQQARRVGTGRRYGFKMKLGMVGVMRVIVGMRMIVILIVMMTVFPIFMSRSLDLRFSLTATANAAHGIFLLDGMASGPVA